MTMKLAPPGRTSVSACTVFHGAGVNHCTISWGSVQQRHSFSRGTSMSRVSTSSRSDVMVLLQRKIEPLRHMTGRFEETHEIGEGDRRRQGVGERMGVDRPALLQAAIEHQG